MRTDLPAIAMMMERAGRGGALYRDFLHESAHLVEGIAAEIIGDNAICFAESALLWTREAELIAHAGSTGKPDRLSEAAEVLRRIEAIETAAMTALASLEEVHGGGGPA